MKDGNWNQGKSGNKRIHGSHEGETGDITTMPSKESPVTKQAAHNRIPLEQDSSRRD